MSRLASVYKKLLKMDLSTKIVILFFILLLFVLLLRTFFVVVSMEFLSTYSYMTSDSYDWLANGLFYFTDVPISYRNIGLPLLIRLLSGFEALWLLPYLNSIVFWFFLILVYKSVEWVTQNWFVALLFSVVMLINYELYEFTKYILSDFYAITLISTSVYFLAKKNHTLGFLMLGFSALFQNFAFFLLPVWVFFYLISRLNYKINKNDLQNQAFSLIKPAFVTVGLFLLPNIPIMLYKLAKFGNPIYSEVTQFELLSFHTDSISYYTVGMIDLVTPVIFLLCIIGLIATLTTSKWKEYVYHISGLVISIGFWVLIYDWYDKRFLLYALPFVLVLSAYGLTWLYQRFFKENLRFEVYAIVILFLVIIISWVPSKNFFDSETIHIIPTYAYVLEHNGEEYIEERSSFRSYPYKDVLYHAPFWGDFLRYRDGVSSSSIYGVYTEDFNDRYNSEEGTFCIEELPLYDFYTLRSVFRIYASKNINGKQLLTSDCLR